MTTISNTVVADDATNNTPNPINDYTLGKLARKFRDLFTRVETGGVDAERAFFGIKIGAENPPEPGHAGCTLGTYVLESRWAYDNSHREYATLTFEKCDVESEFESIVDKDPSIYSANEKYLLQEIRDIYRVQVPTHGNHKMVRLYRVVQEDWFGYNPGANLDGELKREDVILSFCLKPVCDFDDKGNPIPCKIEPRK